MRPWNWSALRAIGKGVPPPSLACALLIAMVAAAGCENVSSSSATQAATQVPGQCEPAPIAAPADLRGRAGYTEITATVTDANGAYVKGLGKDDFTVLVDGSQRQIEFFQPESNSPASVGILVDTSGSMKPKLPQARAAITEFINDLKPQDDIFLVAFSTRHFLLQPLTTDHELVKKRLDLLRAYGNTALFDAIIDGKEKVASGCYEKRVLFVITDGLDNASKASVNDVAAEPRRSGVLIYSIGIGDPNVADMNTPAIGPIVIGDSGIEFVDAKTLHSLAKETGGRTFIIRQVGDGDSLKAACQTIADDLRAQYTLGFVAPDSASAAATGQLAVSLRDKPGLTVRTRQSVPLPSPSVTSTP